MRKCHIRHLATSQSAVCQRTVCLSCLSDSPATSATTPWQQLCCSLLIWIPLPDIIHRGQGLGQGNNPYVGAARMQRGGSRWRAGCCSSSGTPTASPQTSLVRSGAVHCRRRAPVAPEVQLLLCPAQCWVHGYWQRKCCAEEAARTLVLRMLP